MSRNDAGRILHTLERTALVTPDLLTFGGLLLALSWLFAAYHARKVLAERKE